MTLALLDKNDPLHPVGALQYVRLVGCTQLPACLVVLAWAFHTGIWSLADPSSWRPMGAIALAGAFVGACFGTFVGTWARRGEHQGPNAWVFWTTVCGISAASGALSTMLVS